MSVSEPPFSAYSHFHSILVLDELDHIANSFQSLVSLFSLPHFASSSVRIIGIANTHTLTSSLSQFSNSIHTVSGVKTLHFVPYTPVQLLEILRARLGTIGEEKKFMPTATLTLLTKKIAAMTGDVRALFEVLRGAIDLAVASEVDTHMDLMNMPPPVVMPSHILAALKAYTPASSTAARSSSVTSNSEVVVKIRNLGLQSQLVMLAVLLASKRLEAGLSLNSSSVLKRSLSASVGGSSAGVPGMDVGTLHAYYGSVLSRAGSDVFQPVSRSEFGDLMGMLETVGLVALSSASSPLAFAGSPTKGGRRTFGRSVSCGGLGNKAKGAQEIKIAEGVRAEEVQRGLGIGNMDEDVRAGEIRAIWEREGKRLGRDAKGRAVTKVGYERGGEFEDAMED